nr:hypothetical protein BaRGS_035304 [Batillaria attramentaria]
MFQNLNSGISNTQFLRPASSTGQVITIPAGEKGTILPGDPNVNKTCPNHLTRLDTAPLSHRSLCPFYTDILQLPEGYYPNTFNYAKCKCSDCVENSAFGCEPVVTEVTVLKPKGCSNGMQLYEEEIIPIHTSCTCAFRGKQVESEDLPYSTTTAAPSGGQEDW